MHLYKYEYIIPVLNLVVKVRLTSTSTVIHTYGGVGMIAVSPGHLIVQSSVTERLLLFHDVPHVFIRLAAGL